MKNKKVILGILITILLIGIVGITYAAYSYSKTGVNNKLIAGDIYMRYKEDNSINFTNAMPSSTYVANQYFEFQIIGKNTTTNKDIIYDIVLNYGDNHATRTTRIRDELLKFRLVTVSNNVETEIFNDRSYSSINNTRIHVTTIPKNTTNEITHTYRLYAWISNDTLIGNTSNADYTTSEWDDVYASIKVNVTGDFSEKEVYKDLLSSHIRQSLTEYNSDVDSDEVTYISGCSDKITNDANCTEANTIDFNFVWYSGKLWRITAIYPTGEMKLITESPITTINWGPSYRYSSSWVRQWLNEDFILTLVNNNNVLVSENEDFYWNAKLTETTNKQTKQDGFAFTDAVGLIDAYEYTESYKNTSNTPANGYLNISLFWSTITPYSMRYVDYVGATGILLHNSENNRLRAGIRPCIIFRSNVSYLSGDGSRNNPYIISEDIDLPLTNALLNTRVSGEYVIFKNELFRIVGFENGTIKIVKADFLTDGVNILTKNFASDTTFGSSLESNDDSKWDYYLNKVWLTNSDKNWLEMGTYYLGTYIGTYNGLSDSPSMSYKATICSNVNGTNYSETVAECDKLNTTFVGYAGLLRVGEMFSTQINESQISNQTMWLISPHIDSSKANSILSFANMGVYTPDSSFAVRPAVNLKSTIIITDGDGTQQHPFTLAIGS